MFERYTEKARRVVFFARFEASQYGHLSRASRASHSITSPGANQIHAPEQRFLADSPTSRRAYCLELTRT